MAVKGIDYAWGRPSTAKIKAAGFVFVCRYLSHDTTGKNLTREEAERLSKAGLNIVCVWETTAKRPLSGYEGGKADAKTARAQATSVGMPAKHPIYFAADWDARSATDLAKIAAYLSGAASVLGKENVGLYGGYTPIKYCFDRSIMALGWQTYAWSAGKWDTRANLRQYSNDHTLDGVGVDYNQAMKVSYGQWRIGTVTTPKPTPPKSVPIPDPLLKVDGVDGQSTWKAMQRVLNYRNNAGLIVDGIPGKETIKALQRALNGGKL